MSFEASDDANRPAASIAEIVVEEVEHRAGRILPRSQEIDLRAVGRRVDVAARVGMALDASYEPSIQPCLRRRHPETAGARQGKHCEASGERRVERDRVHVAAVEHDDREDEIEGEREAVKWIG